MDLKRKGGVEKRTSVIFELQIERAPYLKKKKMVVVRGCSENSIVQEVGSLM